MNAEQPAYIALLGHPQGRHLVIELPEFLAHFIAGESDYLLVAISGLDCSVYTR